MARGPGRAEARVCRELARWALAQSPDSTPAPHRTQRPPSTRAWPWRPRGGWGLERCPGSSPPAPRPALQGCGPPRASTGLHAARAGRVLSSASQRLLSPKWSWDSCPGSTKVLLAPVTPGAHAWLSPQGPTHHPHVPFPLSPRVHGKDMAARGREGICRPARGRARCLASAAPLLPIPPTHTPPLSTCAHRDFLLAPVTQLCPASMGHQHWCGRRRQGTWHSLPPGRPCCSPEFLSFLAAHLSPPRRARVDTRPELTARCH